MSDVQMYARMLRRESPWDDTVVDRLDEERAILWDAALLGVQPVWKARMLTCISLVWGPLRPFDACCMLTGVRGPVRSVSVRFSQKPAEESEMFILDSHVRSVDAAIRLNTISWLLQFEARDCYAQRSCVGGVSEYYDSIKTVILAAAASARKVLPPPEHA